MGWPQMKMLMDGRINGLSDRFRRVPRRRQGRREVKMDPALFTRNPLDNVLEVLPWRLCLIDPAGLRRQGLGLRTVAGIELKGDGHGDDGKVRHHLLETARPLSLAHEEHLDDGGGRTVLPIFGAPFPLSDPNGRALS